MASLAIIGVCVATGLWRSVGAPAPMIPPIRMSTSTETWDGDPQPYDLYSLGVSGSGSGLPLDFAAYPDGYEPEYPPPKARHMTFGGWPPKTHEAMRTFLANPTRHAHRPRPVELPESPFVRAADAPESTVALETDTASYTILRQQLRAGALPEPGTIRLEELVNAFQYAYPAPLDGEPLALDVELVDCPWDATRRVARVGVQASAPPASKDRPPANLVLLIDVSGSMQDHAKLGLVKAALAAMVPRLDERDRVAIVVYAGAAGLVLPSTPATDREAITAALGRLEAGGSTDGGAGITLAYETALGHFLPGGINRVILWTDGDFNVGVTDTAQLVALARGYADQKVFLTVLGVGDSKGMNDALMEEISNRCDGHYAFLDTPGEARRVLVEQLTGTLLTVAKDTKLQVVFDPARVESYRLLGYENRRLSTRDFDDDKVDAGEIGAGHTSTALYEIVPAAGTAADPAVPLLRARLRYKKRGAEASTLRELAVGDARRGYAHSSGETQLAIAIAEFALALRKSTLAENASLDGALELAKAAVARFEDGRPPADLAAREELVELIGIARELAREAGK